MRSFVERIRANAIGMPLDDLPVDLKIGGHRLLGKLGNRYRNGSLFYRYADLKGKDFVSAWLHHLIINQIEGQNTYLLSTDEDMLFESSICQPAILSQLIDVYKQGQQQPNAFFVEAALAYIRQAQKQKTSKSVSKSPMDAAKDCLLQAVSRAYEPEFRQLYGNVADMSLVLPDSFSKTCESLLLPAWEAAHGY